MTRTIHTPFNLFKVEGKVLSERLRMRASDCRKGKDFYNAALHDIAADFIERCVQ